MLQKSRLASKITSIRRTTDVAVNVVERQVRPQKQVRTAAFLREAYRPLYLRASVFGSAHRPELSTCRRGAEYLGRGE